MININKIINKYRSQMTAAGLLREAGAAQLSPQVTALRPSLTKVNRALAENPDLLRREVKPSPFQALFEFTLPKIEATLQEMEPAEAQKLVELICNGTRRLVEENGMEASRELLENLFLDLPDYMLGIKDKRHDPDKILAAYQDLFFKSEGVGYLSLKNAINYQWEIGDEGAHIYIQEDIGPREMRKLERIRDIYRFGLLQEEINEDIFNSIMRMPHLTEVYIRGINDQQLERLTAFRQMKYLDLGCSRLTARGLRHLSAFQKLEDLLLEDRINDNNGLAVLADIPTVKTLHLAYALELNDAGLQHVLKMKGLESLDLERDPYSDQGISDRGMKGFGKLARLKHLKLDDTDITDKGLKELRALTELKTLELKRTRIKGPGLAYLTGLTSLRELNLIGTAIDDNCLEHLMAMTHLEKLAVNSTNISDAGILQLKKALPGTQIFEDI